MMKITQEHALELIQADHEDDFFRLTERNDAPIYIVEDKENKVLVEVMAIDEDTVIPTVICGIFELKDSNIDIKTNRKFYHFSYFDQCRKEPVDIVVTLNDLNKKGFSQFVVDNGILIFGDYESVVLQYVKFKIQNTQNYQSMVDFVGFSEDLKSFYTINRITALGTEPVKLTDNFKKALTPKGSIEEYNEMLKQWVTYPEIQLGFVLGFAGTLNTYMQDLCDTDILLTSLVGKSTTGKTTTSMLALSVFGSPHFDTSSGLGRTANATNLSLQESMANINGLSFLIDDISATYTGQIEKLVYTLASGQGKGRCTIDYEQPENSKWSGLVIFNSEEPLFKSKPLEGATCRLINFQDLNWTQSHKQAESIKAVVKENYGFYGEMFVKKLFSMKKSYIKDMIDYYGRNFSSSVGHLADKFTARRARKLAIILTTAKLVKEMMKDIIDIDVNGIEKLLLNEELQSLKFRNRTQSIRVFIENYLKQNNEKFLAKTRDLDTFWGFYEDRNDSDHYFVELDKFERILEDAGCTNDKAAMIKDLVKENFIIPGSEKDRLTTRKTMHKKSSSRCYHVVIKK